MRSGATTTSPTPFARLSFSALLDGSRRRTAHIPLIHGPDGAKLSKRHGAVAVGAYAELGILPAAMRNALLRLGWSHGDDEIIDTAQATAWFDLGPVNRGAARFDMEKLQSLNGHYIRESADAELLPDVEQRLASRHPAAATDEGRRRIAALLPEAKTRAKTLVELADNLAFLFRDPQLNMSNKAAGLLDDEARVRLGRLRDALTMLAEWDQAELERFVRAFAEGEGVGLGKIAQPLRAALTGSHASPGIFAVMAALGSEVTLTRLTDVAPSIESGMEAETWTYVEN